MEKESQEMAPTQISLIPYFEFPYTSLLSKDVTS